MGYQNRPPWQRDEWEISLKFTDGLFKFDAEDDKYLEWKSRSLDHLDASNRQWRVLCKMAEECSVPIERDTLQTLQYDDKTGWDLAQILWTFLSRWIGPGLYRRRLQLAHGIEFNGFELWRRLHCDFEGGDVVTQLAGKTRLQNFPVCSSNKGLSAKLDDWSELMLRYGGDVGPEFARTMLLKILPEGLRYETIKSRDIYSVQEIMSWVKSQLVWGRSNELAAKQLKQGGPVNSMTEPSERPATGAPSAPATPTLAGLAKMITAIGGADRGRKKDKGDRGRKASPRSGSPAARTRTVYGDASFKGCWHCGKEHTPINR